MSELLGETPPDTQANTIAKYEVSCPHCSTPNEWEVWLDGGLQSLSHCDEVISMLVPTAGGGVTSPASLVKAWWPTSLKTPSGTPEEKCLATWALVARQVDYCYDPFQREGIQECWLPAPETWLRGEGDCEDHSILLASMLLHLGINAWVVWGKVDSSGHAWVEVEIDGSLRLIESTAKHPLPERVPLIQEADDTYGLLSYEADQDCPGRTNGTIYSNFTAGSWCDVALVEPVAIH